MKVSVIMSEYNTDKEILQDSIFSILDQTYKDFEFIIVNDGNSEELRQLIKEIDDYRIHLLENGENIGLAKSLNKAIKYSSGKYLVRMDTDDIAYPDRIEKQLSFIERNREYSVVGTSINILTEDNERIPKKIGGEIDATALMNRKAPVHPSVIIRKKDVLDVGCYETRNVQRSEDFVLWAKLLLSGKKIYVMEDILLDYRVTIDDYSKRNIKTRRDEIYNRIIYYNKLGASLPEYLSIVKSIVSGLLPGSIMALYHRKK